MVGLSKIPQKGVEQKRGEGNKYLKSGGKLGQGVGAIKRGGWNSLTNYDLIQN